MSWLERKRDQLKQENEQWLESLLKGLGRTEWGESNFIVTSDPSETGEEGGWVVKKLAESPHYHIGISERGFFIRTGGETIFSKDITEGGLREALDEVLKQGPTHLEPPGRVSKQK